MKALKWLNSLCATAGLLAAIPVVAAPGRCLLEVGGKSYLDGSCNIERSEGGSFSIGAGDSESSLFFAYVQIDEGVAQGFWNGPLAERHAHEPLGTLARRGACWVNNNAKVCAWSAVTAPAVKIGRLKQDADYGYPGCIVFRDPDEVIFGEDESNGAKMRIDGTLHTFAPAKGARGLWDFDLAGADIDVTYYSGDTTISFIGKNTGGCTPQRCEAYDLVVTATLMKAGTKTVMKDLTGVCGAYH